MKAFRIMSHPIFLIISFCLILISGEQFGGFYLLYLLMALPYGGIHSILALVGIMILLFSYAKFRRSKKYFLGPTLNVFGVGFLLISLFVFFYNDRLGYNYGTFEQLVPQVSLTIFGLLALNFIIDNFIPAQQKKNVNRTLSVL